MWETSVNERMKSFKMELGNSRWMLTILCLTFATLSSTLYMLGRETSGWPPLVLPPYKQTSAISSHFIPMTNSSQGKVTWKPSNFSFQPFMGRGSWAQGLKFHLPCNITYHFPCCSYHFPARKLHFQSGLTVHAMSEARATFLQKVQKKRVFLIGDSLMRQLFQSVADLLDVGPITTPYWVKQVQHDPGLFVREISNTSNQISVTNIHHYVLSSGYKGHTKKALSWELFQLVVRQGHIVVFNMGLHYTFCARKIFTETLRQVTEIFKAEVRKHPEKQIIFRSTLPQHFPGNDGYFAKSGQLEKCANRTTYKEHFTNQYLKDIAKFYRFKYMDSFPIYMDRWDLHNVKPGDCTHSCITTEITVPELALLNSLLH